MPNGIQEWLGAAIVVFTAIALLRAQWAKAKAESNNGCDGCHKQSTIGKPQPTLRGIKIKVASKQRS